ncbi:unnamed protein product [Echinostoma caproni]|uniref:INTS8 TPR repeats domain-containing protein n=1 Tax=Echinostoma caproni TaxID=27848 RepID=A0A183B9X7_9TREM|nr:unnamed protein product [Echinostoma caproni]
MLACSCAHGHTGREPDAEHPHADAKRRFGPSNPGSRKSSPALYLLSYLITCLSHITHAVCPEFQVPKLPPLDVVVDACLRSDFDSAQWERSIHSSKLADSSIPGSDAVRRKRSRWDPVPIHESGPRSNTDGSGCLLLDSTTAVSIVAASLLSDARWPTDVPSNTKLPPEAMHNLLLLFLNSGLAFFPTQIDWLLLRAEVEFHLNRPRAALITYLEACAIVLRMVRICQSLGLMGEAVVLCQLAPNGALIELGLQLITSVLEPYTTGSQAPDANGTQPPTGDPTIGPPDAPGFTAPSSTVSTGNVVTTTTTTAPSATHGSASRSRFPISTRLTERPRGACGGFLTKSSWDCLDPLIDYVWDIQLLETLSSSARMQGALSVQARVNASLSLPELNVNNRDEILRESVEARTLDFLRWMADQHF